MEALNLDDRLINALKMEDRDSFRSEIGHWLKEKGDMQIIREILIRNPIMYCINQDEKYKALYLLALLDFLSKRNSYPICPVFDSIRSEKMDHMIYPSIVYLIPSEELKKQCESNAIDEFVKYNICEGDIDDVC